MRSRLLTLTVTSATVGLVVALAEARGTKSQPVPSPAEQAGKGAAPAGKHPATLAQLMRGVFFLHSNVIFSAQGKNPADAPMAKNPSSTTDPLGSAYGKWEAVENSSLAIVEAADLLTVPTRVCSNGRSVPTTNPDWPKLVQGLRDAGMQSYAAAKAKDQDKVADAAEALTNACGNCHVIYRDHEKLEDRCR